MVVSIKYDKNVQRAVSNDRERRNINRQSNAKRHKKRHKKNYILYYILLSFFLIVVSLSLSLTVFFNVTEIRVVNNGMLDKNEIIKSSEVKIGNNLFRLNSNEVEQKILKSNIIIDSVKINKVLPSLLEIKLEMSKTMLAVKYDGYYYCFSYAGRLINKTDKKVTPDIIVFSGVDLEKLKLGEYIAPNDTNNYETSKVIMDALKVNKISKITYVDIRDISNIKLYYNNQIEIKIGNTTNIEYKLKLAKEVIETKITGNQKGILDAQINGKAYFRILQEITFPE